MESEELVFLLLSHTKTEGCHMNSCPDALHMLEMYSSLFFDETESEEQDFLLLNRRGTEGCVLVRWNRSRTLSSSATPKLKKFVFLRDVVGAELTPPQSHQTKNYHMSCFPSLCCDETESEEQDFLLLSHTKTKGYHLTTCPADLHILVKWNRRRSSCSSATPKLKYRSLCFCEMESEQNLLLLSHTKLKIIICPAALHNLEKQDFFLLSHTKTKGYHLTTCPADNHILVNSLCCDETESEEQDFLLLSHTKTKGYHLTTCPADLHILVKWNRRRSSCSSATPKLKKLVFLRDGVGAELTPPQSHQTKNYHNIIMKVKKFCIFARRIRSQTSSCSSSLYCDETESEEQDLLLLSHTKIDVCHMTSCTADLHMIPIQPRLILPAHVGQERPNHEMPHAMNQNLRSSLCFGKTESEEQDIILLSHTKNKGCHMTSCPAVIHVLVTAMESEELVFLLLSHTKTEGCHMNSCPDALHMLEMYSSLFFDETESEEQDFLLLNHRGTEETDSECNFSCSVISN
ncbi:hypothetical protein J6590_059705 [Homalodisca vitripennis]|nr:hypothetical protein J6590_059705 [Homalodisca vitripennis]